MRIAAPVCAVSLCARVGTAQESTCFEQIRAAAEMGSIRNDDIVARWKATTKPARADRAGRVPVDL